MFSRGLSGVVGVRHGILHHPVHEQHTTGNHLLKINSKGLKDLGMTSKDNRKKIRKKIKELQSHNKKQKKDRLKEKMMRDKLLKKVKKSNKKKYWLLLVLDSTNRLID
jgi:hypothetical protein